jgi:hypothetical protein
MSLSVEMITVDCADPKRLVTRADGPAPRGRPPASLDSPL